MHGFPFEACPTAVDLVRYATSRFGPRTNDHYAFVERHLPACRDCSRAVEQFTRNAGHPAEDAFVDWAEIVPPEYSDELHHQHIATQRDFFNRVLSSVADDPRPGDIWVSTHRRGLEVIGESGVPWLLLVLDSYQREYTASWVVDAVPVTEDPQVAADWSLVVSEERNDFGMTIVAHLDFQFTTSREALHRRLGGLSQVCFDCVRLVLRAYEVGEVSPQCLECGTLGSAAIRSRADWLALDAELRRLVDEAMVSFDDDTEPGYAEPAPEPSFRAAEPWHAGENPPSTTRSCSWREGRTTPFSPPTSCLMQTFDARGPLTLPFWAGTATDRAAQARTFRDALILFLDERCTGDLQVWATRENQSIAPGDLEPVLDRPFGELIDISPMYRIPRLGMLFGLRSSSAVVKLLNMALDHLNERLAASDRLSYRAARRQDPFGTTQE